MFKFLLSLTIKRLLRNPLRSLLSVLQIALGAFAALVVLAMIAAKTQSGRFGDTFLLNAASVEKKNGSTIMTTYELFRPGDVEALLKATSSIELAETYGDSSWPKPNIEVAGKRFKLQTTGVVGASYPQIIPMDFVAGGFYTQADVDAGQHVLVISQTVAKNVFGDAKAIGQTVMLPIRFMTNIQHLNDVRLIPYRVVGVFKDLAAPGDTAEWSSFHLFRPPMLGKDQKINPSMKLLVKAKAGRLLEARAEILNAARGFYANSAFAQNKKPLMLTPFDRSLSDESENSNTPLDSAIGIFGVIGLAVLTVCSISIFSIQMVSVAEQTREIGLQKALGASSRAIIREYLFSSSLLAFFGALLGLMLAVLLMPTMANALIAVLPVTHFYVTPLVALEGLGLVVMVGVLFGLYPALIASRLRPVEALQDS